MLRFHDALKSFRQGKYVPEYVPNFSSRTWLSHIFIILRIFHIFKICFQIFASDVLFCYLKCHEISTTGSDYINDFFLEVFQ